MRKKAPRRCPAGHSLTGANGSWQINGSGMEVLTCRKCNAARARAWRQKNAHRLTRKYRGTGSPGQTLERP